MTIPPHELPQWALDITRCAQPECDGRLGVARIETSSEDRLESGMVVCESCEALYPVLGGILILISDVPEWIASHKEPILAALAEYRRLTPEALELVEDFASAAPRAEPRRFEDDWVSEETPGQPPVRPLFEAPSGFHAFVDDARGHTPHSVLVAMCSERARVAVEIGCGAGTLTRTLSRTLDHVIATDASLRAVLQTLKLIPHDRVDNVAGVVMDAEELPIRRGMVDAIFAANVVDIVDSPQAFADSARAALEPGAHLLLTTPAPDLGFGDDSALETLLEESGFQIEQHEDAIPWLRAHDERQFQVFFVLALKARAI